MSRTIQRMDVGKHIRIWEDERGGFVSWSDGSKTFEEAQLLGMQVFSSTPAITTHAGSSWPSSALGDGKSSCLEVIEVSAYENDSRWDSGSSFGRICNVSGRWPRWKRRRIAILALARCER